MGGQPVSCGLVDLGDAVAFQCAGPCEPDRQHDHADQTGQ